MLPGYELPKRTRSACGLMKWATILLGIVYVVFYFYGDLAAERIDNLWEGIESEARDKIIFSEAKKSLLYGVTSLYFFSISLILFGIFRVFAAFQKGDTFAMSAVKPIRYLGVMILVYTFISLTKGTIMHLALTYDSPVGHRLFVVSASTNHAFGLIMGVLFLIIGHVFIQSVRISDENRQIV